MRSFNLKLLCNLKKLIILTAFIFGFSPLFAQLNILVGYGVGYQSSSDIDLIIESHNEQNPWYHNDLNSVTFLHGMYFGLRQDWGTLKTTLCFRSSGQSLSADGVPPSGGDSFERELFFRNNILSLGLETSFSSINLGAAMDYNFFRIKGRTSDHTKNYIVQKDALIGTHLYLNFDFKGKGMMGLALQPYVDIAISDIGLNDLSDELGVNISGRYEPMTYGITILLVNGPQ
jgi:hypothetical protein